MEFPFSSTIAIAHRGAHGTNYPENSLEAIKRAVEIGAPAVEFDVCNLRDGNLVVSHDCWIERDGERVDLSTLSSDEMSLPRVEPFLELVAASNALLNLDWKGAGEERRVGKLLALYGLVERTVVSSEDCGALARLKEARPYVTAGLSVDCSLVHARMAPSKTVRRLARLSAVNAIMLDYQLVSTEVVDAVRGENAGLFLWTARDTATFESLLRFAPDGIATDIVNQQLRYSSG